MPRTLVRALVLALPALSSRAADPAPVALVVPPALACPARAEIARALGRQGLAAIDGAAAPVVLRVEAEGAAVALDLRDAGGAPLLRRSLPADDCHALADTIALLVERRVRGIAWEGPPPPTAVRRARSLRSLPPRSAPARRPSIDARAGLLLASGLEDEGARPGPWAGARVRLGRPAACLSAGWVRHAVPAGDGSVTVDRIPLDLLGGVVLGRGRVEVDLDAQLEVEVLHAFSRGLARTESRTGLALRAGPAAGVAARATDRIWLSLAGSLGFRLRGKDLVVEGLGTVARHGVVAGALVLGAGARFEL